MKGFVPTPDALVDDMVERLFTDAPPRPDSLVLDPGCGEGVFIAGVLRWCARRGVAPPRIVGVEMHPDRASEARRRFADVPSVEIRETDFLARDGETADFVVGNPPYVSITGLSEDEKTRYRERFTTASGRFDLYALFFEQALRRLVPGGRLVFVTPEKYLTTAAARPLRALLGRHAVRDVVLLPEDTFPGVVTYPAVTVVDAAAPGATRVALRNGTERRVTVTPDGAAVHVRSAGRDHRGLVLGDVTQRISCGVATGADGVFVRPLADLPDALAAFAYPTLSGRQLTPGLGLKPTDAMLLPYDETGALLPPERLGALGTFLGEHRIALEARTCARRKPWVAFHETPPLSALLLPKLLCKDIAQRPHFWIDRDGSVVPRHSVYYIVPTDGVDLDALAEALNSESTAEWLIAHAQPAANGYRRLQSTVLRQIPLPDTLAPPTVPDLFHALDLQPT